MVDPNSIRFCEEHMEAKLNTQLQFETDKGKTAEERLVHLWAFDDGLNRQGWEDKKYRVLYKILATNWNSCFGELADWEWSDFFMMNQHLLQMMESGRCGLRMMHTPYGRKDGGKESWSQSL